ncbi:MAG: hypothetical protein ICV87_12040 [Gemmatimonadetes bacterium]|nr:hypothetical protein [Gemmatimonadota bacterium]
MPRPARSRTVRNLLWGAGGLVLGIALAFLALNIVARTKAGHKQILEYTLNALARNVQGKLGVERISGNLFEGARLYRVSLREFDGTPFLLADSADVTYDVRTLLSPRIRINRLVLYRPDIYIRRFPGDSLWNYQEIFRDTTPQDPNKRRVQRVTFVDTLRVVGGVTKVEIPWSPDTTTSARAQREEVRLALRDTSPVIVRRARGGYVRTINMTQLTGRLREIRFAPGSQTGSRLRIDTLRGQVQFFRRPADVRHVQGIVAILPDRVEFDAPVLRLPGSRTATSGVVCLRNDTRECGRQVPDGELPYYDVAFRADTVSFRDLQWMYPRFPSTATGKMSLFLETRPEGTLFDIRGARFDAPGTRIDGSFGITVGDTIVFSNVDVQARPVRVSTIERMLPEGLPVRGLVLGSATIKGAR